MKTWKIYERKKLPCLINRKSQMIIHSWVYPCHCYTYLSCTCLMPWTKVLPSHPQMPNAHYSTFRHSLTELLQSADGEAPWCFSLFYESRDTRDTNSRVIRPLDLVLITKCSGYFLNSISNPYHGFPLDSGPDHSSEVRYFLTRLWCQILLYCSTSCMNRKHGKLNPHNNEQ